MCVHPIARPQWRGSRLFVELLDERTLLSVNFHATNGMLSVASDETGPVADTIRISLGPVTECLPTDDCLNEPLSRFVDVTINDVVHSSDPASSNFDRALSGATGRTVKQLTVRGGQKRDEITLDDGFSAAGGRISLSGGPGDDVITGSAESERILGGSGDDEIRAGDGSDTLLGGSGDDFLIGGLGKDTMHGGDGNDILIGNLDNARDRMFGDDGNDVLNSGCVGGAFSGVPGDDLLVGGPGTDHFLVGGGPRDRIGVVDASRGEEVGCLLV